MKKILPVDDTGMAHADNQALACPNIPLAHCFVSTSGQDIAVFYQDTIDVVSVASKDAYTFALFSLEKKYSN